MALRREAWIVTPSPMLLRILLRKVDALPPMVVADVPAPKKMPPRGLPRVPVLPVGAVAGPPADGRGRRPGPQKDAAARVAQGCRAVEVGSQIAVGERVAMGRAGARDAVSSFRRDRPLRLDRGLESADGV